MSVRLRFSLLLLALPACDPKPPPADVPAPAAPTAGDLPDATAEQLDAAKAAFKKRRWDSVGEPDNPSRRTVPTFQPPAGMKVKDTDLATLPPVPFAHGLLFDTPDLSAARVAVLKGRPTLTRLLLFGFSPTDEELKRLADLPRLASLTVEGKNLTPAGLRQLADFPALTSLHLFLAYPFSGAAVAELAKLDRLTHLRMSGEGLTADGLTQLAGMKSLKLLELRDPPLTDATAAALGRFGSRIELSFTDQSDRMFATLKRHGILHLTHWARAKGGGRPATPADVYAFRPVMANLTDAGLTELKGFTALEELHLNSTSVTGKGLTVLADLPALHTLSLANTRLSADGLAALKQLKGLKSLSLSMTRSDDATAKAVADDLPELTTLNLFGNKLTGAGLVHLARMKRLTRLDVSNNQITDAGLKPLAGMTLLTELDVSLNTVSDKAVAELKAALPGCAVKHK